MDLKTRVKFLLEQSQFVQHKPWRLFFHAGMIIAVAADFTPCVNYIQPSFPVLFMEVKAVREKSHRDSVPAAQFNRFPDPFPFIRVIHGYRDFPGIPASMPYPEFFQSCFFRGIAFSGSRPGNTSQKKQRKKNTDQSSHGGSLRVFY
jgi:hypothetical protein